MHRFVAALFALLLTLPSLAQAPRPTETGGGLYFGIFLKDTKLGHLHQELDSKARYKGKPSTKLTARSAMNIKMLGANGNITTSEVVYLDPKTGATLAEETRTEASGRVTEVKATYTKDSVSFTAEIQGTKKSGTLRLKPGEVFLRDPSDMPGSKPVPGTRSKGKTFSPDTQTLVDMETVVGEKEPIVVANRTVSAYKIQAVGPVPSTVYVDDEGEILLAQVALGIEIRRLPKEAALAPEGKSVDLADSIGTRPTGVSLEKVARTSHHAVYELGHVTRPLPPSDSVQRWEELPVAGAEKGEKTLKVTVTPPLLPTTPTVKLFAQPSQAPERLRRYLKATEYVPSEDASFVALARKVIGSQTDAARVAQLLAEHTYKTIKADPSILAVRTANDIRKDPRGVCRDYTTYFTTLARAVGLPTKQCTGVAYANGLFLYHAWPEVWVGTDASGNDLWVALEVTWGAPFADATHLKLTEGEITDVSSIAADMGRYSIKVVEVRE
ncbi:transglutaminase-like domain-containing protein [Armatimonas rosea]|uniref:Transglutaminase-like putative cysteine protease n=1 Tax=Armatimonas rosea TaxID=685828 RepID=A0A7W9SV50_ARMRO|nr:transglutaminase-like domain-containing protein [Armatimonas rosea]MBB6052514.1 transglutaminase-like putative cysteine protease [Armatimonas rosea]